MKPAIHTADIQARLGLNRLFFYGFFTMLAANALLAMLLFTRDNNHRQTLVPPVITKSFWVDDHDVSPEYLEMMGTYVLQLALNSTPRGVDTNVKQLLGMVAPASYGEIERAMLASAARLKSNNASTTFDALSVTTDAGRRAVIFAGVLNTWIGDKRTSQLPKTFVVRFSYSGGKTYVVELRESTVKDPLKEQAGGADASNS